MSAPLTTTITTSWDDGHPLDFRLADILTRNNLRATLYIPREAQTGTMTPGQVRELSQRFEIGAHTLNHVFLDTVDDQTARAEIQDSKAWVEDVTGKPCTMFCPPAGKFAPRHLKMIEEAGFIGVRTVEFFSFDPPRKQDGLLVMPTTLQANPNGLLSYARNMARRLALRNLWTYIRHGHSADWTSLTRSLLGACDRDKGVFHLWGHSWELEEHGQWKRLEEVLAIVGEFAARLGNQTNGELCAKCS